MPILIEVVDVLPTLLDFAAIQPPPMLTGRSFYPLLTGGDYQPRDSALTELVGWKTLRTREYRYLIHTDEREWLWHPAR